MNNKFKISIGFKFAASFAVLFLIAMLFIVFAVRKEVVSQFKQRYEQNIHSTLTSIQKEINNQHILINNQLHELSNKLKTDDEILLRTNMLNDIYVPYLVDYAQNYMATMGFQALEILDADGTVLSSGHYRNAFGAIHRSLLENIRVHAADPKLVRFSRSDGQFICLTNIDSVQLANKVLYLAGGVEITPEFLSNLEPNQNDILSVRYSNAIINSQGGVLLKDKLNSALSDTSASSNKSLLDRNYSIREFSLPYLTESANLEAAVILFRPTAELTQMLNNLNQFIFYIAAIVILVAIFVSIWRTSAVTKPLQRLANTASNLSLDSLNVNFEVNSNDEVGVLNEALQKMVERLRKSRMQLSRAEQRAALTEITRQVNHDIKNGFIPIRNVMSHWVEVEESEPEMLPQVFSERKSTVLESLEYLENLTRNYARLKPEIHLTTVNINELIRNLLQMYQTFPDKHVNLQTDLTSEEPRVLADSVQLRRAFENILRNAIDALDKDGEIFVSSILDDEKVLIRWVDNGEGIPEEIQSQLFRTPITTKSGGSGIGLANVRRIIEDFDGTITLSSKVDKGTMVTIALPIVNESSKDKVQELE